MAQLACVCLLCGAMGCEVGPVNERSTQIEGAYEAETRYDMRTLAGTLTSAVDSWDDPDLIIRDGIIGAFEDRHGKTTADLVSSIYGTRIAEQIRSYLQELAPAWVLSLPGSLSMVDAQMRMVDVQTSVLLATQPDGSVKATQIWDGISVFRDPACKESGTNLSCDQIQISISEILDAEYPLDLVSSTFRGSVDADVLAMKGHEVRFNYGRLALYLMANIVLPDKPQAGLQLRDVVMAAINCRGVAGRLAGEDDVLGWKIAGVEVGLSLNELIGSCESGVFGMIDDFIGQFNVPLSMNLSGRFQLLDPNRDGLIDQLVTDDISGQVSTTLLSGKTNEGPVTGRMTGWRVGALPQGDGGMSQDEVDIDDGTTIYDAGEGDDEGE